ncbi:MAG: hypothetical protein ACLR9T_10060, partial [Thomasclavelia sp.]|uniref:hypothetical protein n=1 Tax=Thomasclavelia sp. TaxID=3025757 RepID=UPI0039A019CE
EEVAKANAILNNPNATAEQVNNAQERLTKAIAGLEANSSILVDNIIEKPVNNGDIAPSVKTGDVNLIGIFTAITFLSAAGYIVLRRKED